MTEDITILAIEKETTAALVIVIQGTRETEEIPEIIEILETRETQGIIETQETQGIELILLRAIEIIPLLLEILVTIRAIMTVAMILIRAVAGAPHETRTPLLIVPLPLLTDPVRIIRAVIRQ